jgi:hypothetical protein
MQGKYIYSKNVFTVRKILIVAALSCLTVLAYSQDKKAKKYAKTITAEDLRSYLSVLASDSLEGRDTGSPGQKKAARFIAGLFKEMGLEGPVTTNPENPYYQPYELKKGQWQDIYIKKGDKVINNLEEMIYFSRAETRGEEYVEVVYAGDASDMSDIDVTDKLVVTTNRNINELREKNEEAKAAGFVIINENAEEVEFSISRYTRFFSRPMISSTFPTDGDKIVVGDTTLAEALFEKAYPDLQVGDKSTAIINADMLIEPLRTENVLGFIEGSEKPDEVLVITGHYDHLGMTEDGEIYNGADDDGSGTSGVIEVADAFAEALKKGDRPKRSVLFMCVTGEEKGLLGSNYYIENPLFPLENTVVNLNIDMIGRVDDKHEENPDYIYLIGSDKLSMDLHELSENVNKNTVNLELDYTYNDENDPNRYYYRSDHYNFAKNDIPVIFYFNGTHADYHKTTDTIEKINFEKMTKIVQLVFHTAWEIANRDERIKLTEKEGD